MTWNLSRGWYIVGMIVLWRTSQQKPGVYRTIENFKKLLLPCMQDNNVWFECFWQGWILIHIHSYQRTIFFRHPSIFCSLHRCNIFGRVGRWLGQIGRWLCYHLIYMLRNGWTFFSKLLRWISNEKTWHERDYRINSPRQNRGLTPKSSEENKGNFCID